MTIKTLPTTYKTSDGREFTDQEQAERHEALTAVKRTYEEARNRYATALAESHKTADGHQFDLTKMYYYYYISPGWSGMPEIKQVDFYIWNCDLNDNDETVIVDTTQDRRIEYRISELYWHKGNAEKALVKAWEERLIDLQEQFEEKIKGRP